MTGFTWLTHISWFDVASGLHDNLLLQQRKEAIELVAEFVDGDPDPKHPLYRMWHGYFPALAAYGSAMEIESVRRGYRGNDALKIVATLDKAKRDRQDTGLILPPWREDKDLLRSHRSNLARRWPSVYGDLYRTTPPRMPYLWAFTSEDGGYGLYLSKYDKELLAAGERHLPPAIAERIENL